MLRRVASVIFVAAVALVAGCGHQVTPNPLNNDLSGDILVRLRTQATLDFNDFTYMIAIDTCGTGVPYPNAAFTGYKSYSYAFLIGSGFNTALPELFEYYVNPNSSGSITYLLVNNLDPSTIQFNNNDNGQGNEMSLVFERALLANPLGIAQPCPNATGQPTPGPSASPFQGLTTWTFNLITFQNRVPQDSLGPGGASDTSFPGIVVDTTTTNTQTYNKPLGFAPPPNNPSAELIYGEVDNYL